VPDTLDGGGLSLPLTATPRPIAGAAVPPSAPR
jgi:hypothetical protein